LTEQYLVYTDSNEVCFIFHSSTFISVLLEEECQLVTSKKMLRIPCIVSNCNYSKYTLKTPPTMPFTRHQRAFTGNYLKALISCLLKWPISVKWRSMLKLPE